MYISTDRGVATLKCLFNPLVWANSFIFLRFGDLSKGLGMCDISGSIFGRVLVPTCVCLLNGSTPAPLVGLSQSEVWILRQVKRSTSCIWPAIDDVHLELARLLFRNLFFIPLKLINTSLILSPNQKFYSTVSVGRARLLVPGLLASLDLK